MTPSGHLPRGGAVLLLLSKTWSGRTFAAELRLLNSHWGSPPSIELTESAKGKVPANCASVTSAAGSNGPGDGVSDSGCDNTHLGAPAVQAAADGTGLGCVRWLLQWCVCASYVTNLLFGYVFLRVFVTKCVWMTCTFVVAARGKRFTCLLRSAMC